MKIEAAILFGVLFVIQLILSESAESEFSFMNDGLLGGQQFAKIPEWMKPTQTRIVGGDIAPGPIPWQVHVHFSPRNRCVPTNGTCTCGGIVNENTILSAAHCFYPLETAEFIK